MHQLRYIDEIKQADEVEGMDGSTTIYSSQEQQQRSAINNKEISLGKTLVENLTSKQFDISQYSDEYTTQLEKLIQAKATGMKKTITFTPSDKEVEGDVNKNLLETIKASVQQKRKPKHEK